MVLSMERWLGKVAIVTGASAGIGKEIAQRLVEEGLIVVGLARRSENIEKLAQKLKEKKGKLYAIKADMTKEVDILNAFKWTVENLGPVHILINNAGVSLEGSLTEGETKDWRRVLDINVIGLSIATREAVKIMKKNNINGHIIHLNSIAGHSYLKVPNTNLYGPSKYAVTALTETLRQELNHLGLKIKITSVSPGLVTSEMTTEAKTYSSERLEGLRKAPILKPEDIVDGIIYALSTPEHVQVHELTIKPIGELL